MLAQHKNHLAVHGGGESTVEEMIDWKRLVQLRIHINARVGLQNRPFFSFWIWFTIFENLKTTSYSHILEYYLSNFCALFHFRPMFRFYTGVAFITFAKNRFRYYFFLSTNIENISFLYTLRITSKLCWFYQPDLVEMDGSLFLRREKLD